MTEPESQGMEKKPRIQADAKREDGGLGLLSKRTDRFGAGLTTARKIKIVSPGIGERKIVLSQPAGGGVSKLRKISDIASNFGERIANRYESLEPEIEQDDLYIPDVADRVPSKSTDLALEESSSLSSVLPGNPHSNASEVRDPGPIGASKAEEPPVFVHAGVTAQRTARHIGARAFALGNHVFVGEGEFAPGSRRWDALLSHELVHVRKGLDHDRMDESSEEELARNREANIRGGNVGDPEAKGVKITKVEDDGTTDLLRSVESSGLGTRDRGLNIVRSEAKGYAPAEQPLLWVTRDGASRRDASKREGSPQTQNGTPAGSRAAESGPGDFVAVNRGQLHTGGNATAASGMSGSQTPAVGMGAVRTAPLEGLGANGAGNSEDEQRKWLAVKEQLFEEFLERFQRELRIDRERNGML